MRKRYKVKEKNLTKLKAYLKDGTKNNSERSRRCISSKHDSPKRHNV